MALEEYQQKRDFGKTPEPRGEIRRRSKPPAALSYVIQKHRATRLHYDFRLELDGVLLSWAVPKGPSLDPHEKRLAVHVEDHPIEYGGFEGVIPKGQYGGGTVMLWDRGTWTPLEPDPAAALRKGSIKFRLDGEKLRGNWALVRMDGRAARARAAAGKPERHENWLLIKERDETAQPDSGDAVVAENPLSVATGRSIEAIAADRDRIWDGEKGELPGEPPRPAPQKPARPKGARKQAMPDPLTPQLASLAATAPDGPEWLHEIKYDGYRLLAYIERGQVRLLTRNRLDWTAKFPALARSLAELPTDSAVIDGEVVALDGEGKSSFAALQDALSRRDTGTLVFYAFDLLYFDGYDLRNCPLEERKAALSQMVPHAADGAIRYSDHQHGRGPEVFEYICRYGLEGIVSKRRDRPFRSGRSSEWLKLKCRNEDEFVIIGFTEPTGQRNGFGALLLGYYDNERRLTYAGRVGTGFSDALLADLHKRLLKLARRTAPTAVPKGTPLKGVYWVEPRLVAQVEFSNWTSDGILRHASFIGLREDKDPEEVTHDPAARGAAPLPADADSDPSHSASPRRRRERLSVPRTGSGRAGRKAPDVESAPATNRDGSVNFVGVRLTNPGRVFYPDEGITKLQLAQYYAAIADWALPHLAGRALSMVRCPEGINGQHFYQKHDMPGFSEVLGRIEISDKSGKETYLFIKDPAGLVALAQMGVLEIHPWGSTVDKLETPDVVTFDFDPDEGLPWQQVTAAAVEMREALIGIGLQSFPKTTGGKGLHVVVPLTPRLSWEEVKEFAKWVADRFVSVYPERFTANMAKRARTGRVFIDYLRNTRGATAIGAYSARARAGATVATPLSWDEVETGVSPKEFTVETVPARLKKLKSDPWAQMSGLRQTLSARVRKEIGI